MPSVNSVSLPQPGIAFLAPDGSVSRQWYYFLIGIFNRTGGSSGAKTLQPSVALPSAITPSASPFVYTAPSIGYVMVSGGGISKLEFSRDTVNWFPTGGFYGEFWLNAGDNLRVTYPDTAPSMVFTPVLDLAQA